jgi:hypothetical protein
MKLLEDHGHEITEDWTRGEDSTDLFGAERLATLQRSAAADERGVREAEGVIVVHHDQLCNGLVEFGIALADPRKVLCVLGRPSPTARRQPIFYQNPRVKFFQDPEEAAQFLNECELNGWR